MKVLLIFISLILVISANVLLTDVYCNAKETSLKVRGILAGVSLVGLLLGSIIIGNIV